VSLEKRLRLDLYFQAIMDLEKLIERNKEHRKVINQKKEEIQRQREENEKLMPREYILEKKLQIDFEVDYSYEKFVEEKSEFIKIFETSDIKKSPWFPEKEVYPMYNKRYWLKWAYNTEEDSITIQFLDFIKLHIFDRVQSELPNYHERVDLWNHFWYTTQEIYKWESDNERIHIWIMHHKAKEKKYDILTNIETRWIKYLNKDYVTEHHIEEEKKNIEMLKSMNMYSYIEWIWFERKLERKHILEYFIFVSTREQIKTKLYFVYNKNNHLNPFFIIDDEKLEAYLNRWYYILNITNSILDTLIYVFWDSEKTQARKDIRNWNSKLKRDDENLSKTDKLVEYVWKYWDAKPVFVNETKKEVKVEKNVNFNRDFEEKDWKLIRKDNTI